MSKAQSDTDVGSSPLKFTVTAGADVIEYPVGHTRAGQKIIQGVRAVTVRTTDGADATITVRFMDHRTKVATADDFSPPNQDSADDENAGAFVGPVEFSDGETQAIWIDKITAADANVSLMQVWV